MPRLKLLHSFHETAVPETPISQSWMSQSLHVCLSYMNMWVKHQSTCSHPFLPPLILGRSGWWSIQLCFKWWNCSLEEKSFSSGMPFVHELSRLFRAYANLESVAMKAAMVIPALLLQNPHPRSNACTSVAYNCGGSGRLKELLDEDSTQAKSKSTKDTRGHIQNICNGRRSSGCSLNHYWQQL